MKIVNIELQCSSMFDMLMMISRLIFEDSMLMEGLATLVLGAFTEGNHFQVRNTMRQIKN